MAQVYRARLRGSEREVAVKVQRPGALEAVALDIYILRTLLGAVSRIAGTTRDLRLLADGIGEQVCVGISEWCIFCFLVWMLSCVEFIKKT